MHASQVTTLCMAHSRNCQQTPAQLPRLFDVAGCRWRSLSLPIPPPSSPPLLLIPPCLSVCRIETKHVAGACRRKHALGIGRHALSHTDAPEPLDAAVSDVVKSRTLRSSGSCSRVPCTALSPHRRATAVLGGRARRKRRTQMLAMGSCACVRAHTFHEFACAIIACVSPPFCLPSVFPGPAAHAPAPPAPRRRHCQTPARCRHSGSCPPAGAAETPGNPGVWLDVPPTPAPRSAPSPAAAQARAQIVLACSEIRERSLYPTSFCPFLSLLSDRICEFKVPHTYLVSLTLKSGHT
jgi:hypothetical protein